MSKHMLARALIGVLIVTAFCRSAWAIKLEFNYTYDTLGFFDDPARRTQLERAGKEFSSRIEDELTGIWARNTNSWTINFPHPATGELQEIDNLRIGRNKVVVFVGGRDLSGGSVGIGGPGGFEAQGHSGWLDTVRQRGEQNAFGEGATDYAPWGGSISFDTHKSSGELRDWHFDHNSPTPSGKSDFYTTALHEIGHILGLGLSESWRTHVNEATSSFVGPSVLAELGQPAPLTESNTHWRDALEGADLETGLPRETLLDHSQTNGESKFITRLDLAALRDIGWEIADQPIVLAGDIDGDGNVDLDDFAIFDTYYDSGVGKSQGDLNFDSVVDLWDFAVFKWDYRRLNGQSATAVVVPEPASLTLAAMACCLLFAATRRRKR